MVLETVVKLIADQLKADPAKVTRDARLVEDLGADSAITSLKTVGDVVDYIQARQA